MQVMLKVTATIEASIIGGTCVRNADLSVKMAGPHPSSDMAMEVLCYSKTNNRHTLRELMKYALAGKAVFQAPALAAVAEGMDELLPSLRRSHALLPSFAFHFTSTLLGLGSGRSVYCTSPIRRLRRLPSLVCSLV